MIEVLLASALVLWAGLGVYKSFSSALKVWKRISAYKSNSANVIFFETIARDLRNYGDISGVSFYGSNTRILFLTHNPNYVMAETLSDPSEVNPKDVFYQIEYIFDPNKREVRRKVYPLGKTSPRSESAILKNIDSMNFTYYLSNPENNRIIKAPSVDRMVPKSLEVEVTYRNVRGESTGCRRFIDIEVVK